MNKFRIQLIATGGTLAKGYDAHSGQLVVDNSIVDALLAGLAQPDVEIDVVPLLGTDSLGKDSLDMDAEDRQAILEAARQGVDKADAIVITHGTDTLCQTSALLAANLPDLAVPVVFTGAMVPHSCQGSDARQNVSQALMACRLLPPGVHIVFHGRHLDGARAAKNYDTLTFEPITD